MSNATEQTRLDKCVKYLQKHNLFESAKAVAKAAGQVNCFQHRMPVKNSFSRQINSKLCEALFVMNSDPHCDTRNTSHVRSLIEAYREMNGMPKGNYGMPEIPAAQISDDGGYADYEYDDVYDDGFETDADDDGVEIILGSPMEYDFNEVGDQDVENCILGMTSRGGCLTYKGLCDEMAENAEDEIRIMDALKDLVARGEFEVVSRDPYNGHIDTIMKIR